MNPYSLSNSLSVPQYARACVSCASCVSHVSVCVSAVRGVGLACRAAALKHFEVAVYAASFAGQAAGYGISVAVLILVLADW